MYMTFEERNRIADHFANLEQIARALAYHEAGDFGDSSINDPVTSIVDMGHTADKLLAALKAMDFERAAGIVGQLRPAPAIEQVLEWQEAMADIRRIEEQEPQLDEDQVGGHFGCCPVCGFTDGYLNVTSSHVFYCEEHKIAWNVGANIFSDWRNENEVIWLRNEAKLADFKRIDCNDAHTPDQRKVLDEYKRRHDEWLSRHNVKAVPAMPDGYDDYLPF
jgi:hypothetical protein